MRKVIGLIIAIVSVSLMLLSMFYSSAITAMVPLLVMPALGAAIKISINKDESDANEKYEKFNTVQLISELKKYQKGYIRLRTSGYIMLAVPLIVCAAFIVFNPNTYAEVIKTPIGNLMMVLSFLFYSLGAMLTFWFTKKLNEDIAEIKELLQECE